MASAEPTVDGTWVVTLVVSDGTMLSNRDVARIQVVGIPCVDDGDCDDGQYCNGAETCQDEICVTGTMVDCDDQDDCTEDSCNETDDQCDHVLVPRPGEEVDRCSDGIDNDCDGKTDMADEECADCQADQDCVDGNDCTVGSCVNNACEFSNADAGVNCDDGLYCNGSDECDGNGACLPAGDNPCAEPCMGACSEQNDECTPDPSGTSCEDPGDGLDCTRDACDGSGGCLSVADPARCTDPDVCLPECAVDSTGCVTPPATFTLSCPSPSGDPPESECVADTGGMDNQDACISCTAEIGETVIDQTDFTADGQNCDLEGWELVSGNQCSDVGITNCVPDNNSGECCSDSSRICSMVDGEGVLESDRNLNCMGHDRREFRLRKTFDLTRYRDAEICFETLEHDATNNEWLLVQVSDASHPGLGDRIYCQNDGPGLDDNDRWYQICRDLPPWAADNPAVTVTFIVHSHDDSDVLMIRGISLRAMSMECTRDVRIVMTEDFNGCSDPLPASWNGWTVEGTATCSGFSECYQNIPAYNGVSAEAKNATFTMSKYVDASALDDRVTLCFWYGDDRSDNGESIEVLFDTGAGWVNAWHDERNMGQDKVCQRTCINLSELDPAVNNHPNLGIRFRLASNNNDRVVDLADIRLRGHVFCSDPAKVSVDPPDSNGDGTYDVDTENHAPSDLTARITCEWDSQTPPLTTTTEQRFPPDP
jgi:hypothetical protein